MISNQIKFNLLNPNGYLPMRCGESGEGFDLFADVKRSVRIRPGEQKIISSGCSIQSCPQNYVIQIWPLVDLVQNHKIGIMCDFISSASSGDIKVTLHNEHDSKTCTIERGTKIAQLMPNELCTLEPADDVIMTDYSGVGKNMFGFG